MFCGHANENPSLCECPDDCYCKEHTCKNRVPLTRRSKGTPGVIVGVSGLAGSGKDTVADYLVEHRGYVKIALADPLKRIAQEVYDFTREQLWGPSKFRSQPDKRWPRPEHGPWIDNKCACCGVPNEPDILHVQCFLTPRYAIQTLGTEWGRNCHPDTWVNLCLRTSQRVLANPGGNPSFYTPWEGIRSRYVSDPETHGVVISDIRYRNELAAAKKVGAKNVRVSRPGAGLKGAAGLHSSEQEQLEIKDSEFDVVLSNTTTLDALRDRALEMAAVFAGEKGATSFSRIARDDDF